VPKPKLSLILGAGFSCEASLPSTAQLSEQFISISTTDTAHLAIEQEITERLTAFWQDVFFYRNPAVKPALEDHFTAIDLAANSGHHLGTDYSPRKLRAIRRFSIHRAFQILDMRYRSSDPIRTILSRLNETTDLSVVSVNWDIVVENHFRELGIAYHYGRTVKSLGNPSQDTAGVPLLKLHGSANWVYCDSCRTLFSSPPSAGKAALHQGTFLEPEDFQIFDSPQYVIDAVRTLDRSHDVCHLCGCRMTARVGTFSYRKDYAIQQFQTIWHEAFDSLRESAAWLFIGYSMPEADFEFKQILKSAELTNQRKGELRKLVVLLRDSLAAKRYKRFFGLTSAQVSQRGLSGFTKNGFDRLLKRL